MEGLDRIVPFDIYCPKCVYNGRGEKYDPCNECLDYGGRINSERPVNFEAADGVDMDILAPETRKVEFNERNGI